MLLVGPIGLEWTTLDLPWGLSLEVLYDCLSRSSNCENPSALFILVGDVANCWSMTRFYFVCSARRTRYSIRKINLDHLFNQSKLFIFSSFCFSPSLDRSTSKQPPRTHRYLGTLCHNSSYLIMNRNNQTPLAIGHLNCYNRSSAKKGSYREL